MTKREREGMTNKQNNEKTERKKNGKIKRQNKE